MKRLALILCIAPFAARAADTVDHTVQIWSALLQEQIQSRASCIAELMRRDEAQRQHADAAKPVDPPK